MRSNPTHAFCMKACYLNSSHFHFNFKGKYVYIEASFPRLIGEKAELTKILEFRGLTCITFYYHMYGTTMGTLNVFVGHTKVFHASRNKGNRWILAKLNVKKNGLLPVCEYKTKV